MPLLLGPAARPQPDRRPRVDVRAVDEALDRVPRAPAQREAAQVIGPADAGHEDHRRGMRGADLGDQAQCPRLPLVHAHDPGRQAPQPAVRADADQRRVVRLHRRVRLVEQIEEHRRPVAVARRQDPPQLDRVAVGKRGHPVDRPVLADAPRGIGVDPLEVEQGVDAARLGPGHHLVERGEVVGAGGGATPAQDEVLGERHAHDVGAPGGDAAQIGLVEGDAVEEGPGADTDPPVPAGPGSAYSRPERFTPRRRIGAPVSIRTSERPRTASAGSMRRQEGSNETKNSPIDDRPVATRSQARRSPAP